MAKRGQKLNANDRQQVFKRWWDGVSFTRMPGHEGARGGVKPARENRVDAASGLPGDFRVPTMSLHYIFYHRAHREAQREVIAYSPCFSMPSVVVFLGIIKEILSGM
ncbi:hypothetical protein [Thermonema sp.]|uniref:hypothetical protein n=1 Tax=Thermonema sp. TaxID=2231181 RepID=UPI00258A35E8|nr:hypothetical protein [Thermonema sp.]